MKNDISNIIFPAQQKWPDTIDDIESVSVESNILMLRTGTKHLAMLSQFTQLERLWCFDINHKQLEYICSCQSLKYLYIENLKTADLSCLKGLTSLEVLSIEGCSKSDSLADVGDIKPLQGLAIIHFKNVHDIEPLSGLENLRELAIAGSMWTGMKIHSFRPLVKLNKLQYLHLTNIKTEDDSLQPLAELKELRQLDLANFYPTEEFARLSAKLQDTECAWFAPYVELKGFECKKCGKDTMVMLTGKRKPTICPECDSKRLAKHIQEFEEMAASAA